MIISSYSSAHQSSLCSLQCSIGVRNGCIVNKLSNVPKLDAPFCMHIAFRAMELALEIIIIID